MHNQFLKRHSFNQNQKPAFASELASFSWQYFSLGMLKAPSSSPRKSQHDRVFSPPVRWGLLDFMSAYPASCLLPPPRRPARPPLATVWSSVWRAGPQPRSCEFSVACRTSTAILWVQCGVPDLDRDPVNSVWRAGPQPRSCEFSVACRTSTAIMWGQCGAPDLTRDAVRSVLRAGPQPRSCEFSVARRTSAAIM